MINPPNKEGIFMSRKAKQDEGSSLVSQELIEQKIFLIRGQKVMLDTDLAGIYGVSTKRLNEQVKRNQKRFPKDFLFQLTLQEAKELWRSRSQIATSRWGGRRYLPYVFTEHGALMVANVLNSEKAVTMSVYVIRAFVRMRAVFLDNQILAVRLMEIEEVLLEHDVKLEDVYKKIRLLLLPPEKTDAVGFQLTTTRPGKIG